jgi:hypothetical protein
MIGNSSNGVFSQVNRTIISGAFAQHRITISDADCSWRDEVTKRLEELIRLEPGWDGYRGVPVAFENATFALKLLESTLGSYLPSPQIVPASGGQLQLEWHTQECDIELLVNKPNDVVAWRRCIDQDGNALEEEQELSNNFIEVARWLADMEEMGGAFALAAAA